MKTPIKIIRTKPPSRKEEARWIAEYQKRQREGTIPHTRILGRPKQPKVEEQPMPAYQATRDFKTKIRPFEVAFLIAYLKECRCHEKSTYLTEFLDHLAYFTLYQAMPSNMAPDEIAKAFAQVDDILTEIRLYGEPLDWPATGISYRPYDQGYENI